MIAGIGGRPKKNFQLNGRTIPGLCKLPEGRWRITEGLKAGERFTEHDDARTVARFFAMTGMEATVLVGAIIASKPASAPFNPESWTTIAGAAVTAGESLPPALRNLDAEMRSGIRREGGQDLLLGGVRIPPDLLWGYVAEQIRKDARRIAELTGIPKIANIMSDDVPAAAITLAALISTYDQHAPSNRRTKGQARAAIKCLGSATSAVNINGLNTESLIRFRDAINKRLAPSAAAAMFNKVKAVASFAIKHGMDAGQLTALLARMKVLHAPPTENKAKPQPITREDFGKLLVAANAEWKAILLLSMNMSLYLEDVCTLRWDDFDMAAGTYSGRRGKTKVVRVGWLWPETIAAIKGLPRKGQSPLVFTAPSGIRYDAVGRYCAYKKLRDRAGVATPFSGLRDGGYSAAAAACDEKTAKLFAAHRFAGMMDNYVQRRPDLVKPASDAVHKSYLG